MIKYNLGCYACQLGDLEEARGLVAAAIALNGKFRAMALDDPDLEPLRKDIDFRRAQVSFRARLEVRGCIRRSAGRRIRRRRGCRSFRGLGQ